MKSKKSRYDAIIFDLDGTLIDSLPYHFDSIKKVLNNYGIFVKEKYLKNIIGLATRVIFRKFKEKYDLHEKIETLVEERRIIYYNLIKDKDITFKGVKSILKKLRKNHKLAIVTGSSRITLDHSTSKEFRNFFDIIVTADDTKRMKPYPDPIILAINKLGVKEGCSLMIGDSIYDGIAAKRAKVDFIGVVTGFTSGVLLKKTGAKKVLKRLNGLLVLI
jgi:beta-phosphoglucomutase